jgi:pimeloyl-ACP methyl ester carboxylesterase
MSTVPPTEVVFLPGFDGTAQLRASFVEAIGRHHPARAVGYPHDRKLETLSGYCRHAAAQVTPASRPVLIGESFGGLIAARWAAQDPHVAAIVLCGAFAQSPVPWASIGASMPLMAQFVGANFLVNPMGYVSGDPARRRWTQAFSTAINSLDREVIAERLRIIATENVARDLQALRIPIILLQFEDDLVVGESARNALEAVCQNARIVRFKGPHFAIETRPLESAEALRAPLAELFA